MRVTIIKDDGVVGVDGVFRSVDLSTMPEGVRVMQWEDTEGHSEYYDNNVANTTIDTIGAIQAFIDLWNAAAPPAPTPPTAADMIADALVRLWTSYADAVSALTINYPPLEVASWPKQEAEARAWLLDPDAPTPWLKGMSAERGINIENLVASIIHNADALAPLYGAVTGKWQDLRAQVVALGPNPTQGQLDAIVWQ